jgi:hypothetical protein
MSRTGAWAIAAALAVLLPEAEAAEKGKGQANSNLASGDIRLLESAGGGQGKLKAKGSSGGDWFENLEKQSSYSRKMMKAETRKLEEIRKTKRSLVEELGKTEPTMPSAKRARGR